MKIKVASVAGTLFSNDLTLQISTILRHLKRESGCELYDDSFEQWCYDEWNIIFLHDNEMYPSHLTGLEMDDSTYTMLMLKFNL